MGGAAAFGASAVWLALLVFARGAGLLWLMPVIGGKRVPRTVRLLEAVVLTTAVFPSLWYLNTVPPVSPAEKLFLLVSEYLIGLAVGASAAVFFTAVSVAGALISRVGGFSAAAAIDPESGKKTARSKRSSTWRRWPSFWQQADSKNSSPRRFPSTRRSLPEPFSLRKVPFRHSRPSCRRRRRWARRRRCRSWRRFSPSGSAALFWDASPRIFIF